MQHRSLLEGAGEVPAIGGCQSGTLTRALSSADAGDAVGAWRIGHLLPAGLPPVLLGVGAAVPTALHWNEARGETDAMQWGKMKSE